MSETKTTSDLVPDLRIKYVEMLMEYSRLTAELAQSRESENAVRLREATNEKEMSAEVERLRKILIYLKEQSVSPADDWLIQMCDIALKLRGDE